MFYFLEMFNIFSNFVLERHFSHFSSRLTVKTNGGQQLFCFFFCNLREKIRKIEN